METRHTLLKLRVAISNDFKTKSGETKVGTLFFKQSFTGEIEQNIFYLNDDCNKDEFKELFNASQIFVLDNPTKIEKVMHCIDWDLVDRELDYELAQLEKLN